MIKEASKPSTRRQDIIHPSEVAKTGWCPRSTYLRIKRCRELQDPYWKPAETYGVQLLNIFDEGHYIHDKWQKRIRDMGRLFGIWECDKCHRRTDLQGYESVCSYCGHATLIYREIPLRSDPYLIAGHADGGIPDLRALIEIKSVGTGTVRIEVPEIFKANSDGQKIDLQGLWRDIKDPFPAHVRQGQLYLYLCSEMGLDFNQIIFLYESKFNQGAKEFVVKYDYEAIKPVLVHISSIVHALNGGSPVMCPFNGCKDCDVYGTETSARVGEPTEPIPAERFKSATASRGRGTRSAKRFIRSPRP